LESTEGTTHGGAGRPVQLREITRFVKPCERIERALAVPRDCHMAHATGTGQASSTRPVRHPRRRCNLGR